MVKLLEKPVVPAPPVQAPNRRHSFDRRRSWSSLIDMYRWLSAVALKLGVASLLFLMVATWWEKKQSREPLHGALSGEAVYQWHGFHRIR